MSDTFSTPRPARRPRRSQTRPVADAASIVTASAAYKDLLHALADSVVQYHASRQGDSGVSSQGGGSHQRGMSGQQQGRSRVTRAKVPSSRARR